ncbi:MAG: hypothetical protein FWE95_04550 [Planctomycetaceae bacterium]|nr:hypothetical protein [Planctomycetaceae bacterium]
MIRTTLTFGLLLLVASLHAQEENAYLLRTGTVLEGSATFDGKQYVVQTRFGTMSVPVQNVEFIGKTRADVYLYKRNNAETTDYNALVRLAEWCISHGYREEGIAEYQRAEQVAPNAMFAGIVQQRLQTLRQLDTTEPVQALPTPQTVTPSPEIPVSRAAFESFARRVQPVLVNRCIAAECHGPHGEREFKLGFPQDTMGSTARRNLQAVLTYIDRDFPLESPILVALAIPHGGSRPALGVDSMPFLQTAQWIQQVSRELPPVQRNELARVSELPELFRRTLPQTENRETPRVDPLDPKIFNDRYHRGVR